MKYRTLGKTGLRVSAIGLGTMVHAGHFGPMKDSESLSAIETALDLGVNFIDTSDAYGAGYSETLLGNALKGRRDKVIIATKGGNVMVGPNRGKTKLRSRLYRPGAGREPKTAANRLPSIFTNCTIRRWRSSSAARSGRCLERRQASRQNPPLRRVDQHHGRRHRRGQRRPRRNDSSRIQPARPGAGRENLSAGAPGQYRNHRPRAAAPRHSYRQNDRSPTNKDFKARMCARAVSKARRSPKSWRKPINCAFSSTARCKPWDKRRIAFCIAHPAVSVVIPGARNAEQMRENGAAADVELAADWRASPSSVAPRLRGLKFRSIIPLYAAFEHAVDCSPRRTRRHEVRRIICPNPSCPS